MDKKIDFFYKTDLHVHSHEDSDNNKTLKYTKETFFDAILKSNLDVLAITDHNTFKFNLWKDVQSKFTDKIFFPGAELNIFISADEIKKNNLEVGQKQDFFHAIIVVNPKYVTEFQKINKEYLQIEYQDGTFKYDFNELINKFKDIEYIFIPHQGKSSRNISDYLPNGKKGNEIFKSKLFYYNVIGLDGNSTKNSQLQEALSNNLLKDVPSFEGSDRLNKKDIEYKLGDNQFYTWIQYGKDFESLITALSDPMSRIIPSSVSNVNPQTNLNDYYETLQITFNDETKSHNIPLAPGFNAIIGSRGSGKSSLFDAIHEGSSTNVGIQNINFIKKGITFEEVNKEKVLYINQGYLNEIFRDKKIKSIEKISSLQSMKLEVASLRKKKLTAYRNKVADAFEEFISCFKKIENKPIGKFAEFIDDEKIFFPFSNDFLKQTSEIKQKKENIEKLHENILDIEKYFSNKYEINNFFKEIDALNTYIEIENYNSKIQCIQKNIKVLKEDLKTAFNFDLSNVIKKSKKIYELNDSMNDFNEKSGSVVSILIKNEREAYEYVQKLVEYRKKFKDLSDSIQEINNPEIFNDISIEFEIENNDKYEIKSKEGAVDEKISIDTYLKIDNIVEFEKKLIFSSFDDVKDCTNKKYFRNNSTKLEIIENLKNKIDVEIDNEIKKDEFFQILKNGKSLNDYSPGQIAESIIDILFEYELKERKINLVMMDQPDDNLDNDTIKKVLVKKIKEKKLDIQFIIVSHSASIVINGDASNIIVSEFKIIDEKYNYKYHTTKLFQGHRKEVIDLLDGGEDFFKMRFNKYRFRMED